MSNLALSSTGGAFGTFLYELIEGEKQFKEVFTGFAANSSQGIAMGLLMNNFPYVGIGIASFMSIIGINNIFGNKLIKTTEKFKILSQIIAKNGATLGLSIGGGMVG
jgi:hypothetical protein